MGVQNTIIQVPIDRSLRDRAVVAASNLGFSSIQEAIRVFLVQLPQQSVKISFEQPPIQLSKKAVKRYDKIIDEIESGKMPTRAFTKKDNIGAIEKYLNS